MDFFGILFDMKNGKKIPYSKNYFDTLFAENLAGVTTLTGTLPLTFTTSETTLRSWTIYGNSTPHNYSAEGTLPLTFSTHTAGNASDWEIYGNAQGVGERTENLFDDSQGCDWASGSNGASNQKITAQQGDVFTVTSTSALYALVRGYNADNAIISGSAWSTGGASTYTAPANISYVKVIFRNFAYSTITAEQKATVNEEMLVKGSTAPSTYIPYGYEIPLSVNGTPQTFYIGNSPLTAGQSISKASTGVDIATTEGENTISTTLYNKPEMSITGLDYVGVGEPINDGWQIPLTVSHITDNIFDKDAKNTNKGYEDSTCLMWAGSLTNPYLTGNEDSNCFVSEKIPVSPNTTYYLTDGIFKNADNGIYSVFLWNRQRMSDYQAFPTEKTFTTGDDTKFIQLCVLKAYADTVMITTQPTETYIPHVEVNNVNVPIDAPLTDGQSVTDTLTINTFEGANTIDTTLTNKPQMMITYKGG